MLSWQHKGQLIARPWRRPDVTSSAHVSSGKFYGITEGTSTKFLGAMTTNDGHNLESCGFCSMFSCQQWKGALCGGCYCAGGGATYCLTLLGETKPPPKGIKKLTLPIPGPTSRKARKLFGSEGNFKIKTCWIVAQLKSRSVKRCKINAKNARGPFPKSRASYFRSARFNTSPLCYLRACHRLHSS